jgi:hypothetical protein
MHAGPSSSLRIWWQNIDTVSAPTSEPIKSAAIHQGDIRIGHGHAREQITGHPPYNFSHCFGWPNAAATMRSAPSAHASVCSVSPMDRSGILSSGATSTEASWRLRCSIIYSMGGAWCRSMKSAGLTASAVARSPRSINATASLTARASPGWNSTPRQYGGPASGTSHGQGQTTPAVAVGRFESRVRIGGEPDRAGHVGEASLSRHSRMPSGPGLSSPVHRQAVWQTHRKLTI